MGRLAEVLEYFIEDNIGRCRCDVGGRSVTADHYAGLGEEEVPLAGDFAFLERDSGTGRWVVMRFFDPKWERRAQAGEVVRYSRSSNGEPKAVIHLKADGSIEILGEKAQAIFKADGSIEILGEKAQAIFKADGTVDLNDGAAKLSTAGKLNLSDVVATGEVKAAGIPLSSHGHSAETTATLGLAGAATVTVTGPTVILPTL